MPATENLRSGERRNVTVLFADMKDFTSLTGKLDPEEIDTLMSRVFSGFESIIHRYEGTVEKYIGDALVAVFGVPTLHEDDPSRAVGAALDFLEEIAALNRDRDSAAEIAFRIGVTTGLITTGRRGEYDVVTGHAMAEAARIQAEAPQNGVLASRPTFERCNHEFEFGERQPIVGKGIDEPLAAYPVIGRLSRPAGDEIRCVGRKPIIDRILKRFLRHDATQTQGCLLTGEPGIGKTRVAHEFLATIRELPGFESGILYARARRYRSQSFAAVTDLLCNYFGIDRNQEARTIADVVQNSLEVEEKTALGFARLVAGVADEPENQAFVVLYLILKSIVKRTEGAPYGCLLCVDDLHFMDRSSRDFFQFYLRNADAKPFFLLLNRTVSEPISTVFGEMELIPVEPLDREQSRELITLVAQSVSESEISDEVSDSIAERAEGNPLFIREYTRYALENRDSQDIPATIQNIILTSLESYDERTRDLMKRLSVFALNFRVEDAEHLEELTQGDPKIVRPAIEEFKREGILVEDGDSVMFRFDLFKKTLYDSLLNYNKRILHRFIADQMQERGDPHPMRLLHHLLRAEEYDRAAEALFASPHATTNIEYLRYLDRIIEGVGDSDHERSVRLLFMKSAILFNNGITEETDSLLRGMIGLATTAANTRYAAAAYHLLSAYYSKAYCFEKTRQCGLKALAFYDSARLDGHQAGTANRQNVLEIMASSELLRNNEDEVTRIMTEIEELSELTDDPANRERVLLAHADHHLLRGEYTSALEVLTDATQRLPRESEIWQRLHFSLGNAYLYSCNWKALLEVDQPVLSGPTQNRSFISQTHSRLAAAYHFLGDESESARRLYQAEFTASQIRNDFDRVDSLRTLASVYLMCGDEQKAQEVAEPATAISLRHSMTFPTMTLLMILVEVASRRDEPKAFDYYLAEAKLLFESGMLLANRDLLLFHFHSFRSTLDEEERESYRIAAKQAWTRETAAIGEAFLPEFLRLGPIHRVHRELG